MNENRFWFVIDKGKLEYVQDLVNNEKINVSELEDLLNELATKCSHLKEENEELKKKNVLLREEFIGIIHLLVNENDELTKKLDNIIDIAFIGYDTDE